MNLLCHKKKPLNRLTTWICLQLADSEGLEEGAAVHLAPGSGE